MIIQFLVAFCSCRWSGISSSLASVSKEVDKNSVELETDSNGDYIVNNVDFLGIKAKDALEAAMNVNYFYNYAFISEQKKMVN